MKIARGWGKLSIGTLLALTLTAALTLSSAATNPQVCSANQMLPEVEVLRVAAKEAPAVWNMRGLVKFDYGGDIENGLLEVQFKDIPTDFDFDGYVIEAMPGDDDPGDSRKLGIPDYRSPVLIARPQTVGTTITEVLNLDPGTKYYVTVHAANHNTVQISPTQREQDHLSATTLLSAPFLGAVEYGELTDSRDLCTDDQITNSTDGCGDGDYGFTRVGLDSDDFEGTHFALFGVDAEAGQHYFRWLNAGDWGPYDHVGLWRRNNDGEREWFQPDMFSMNEDGIVEDHCSRFDEDDSFGDTCSYTHYRFEAVDATGNIVASELVETEGSRINAGDRDYYQAVFTAESGELTLSVSLGRMVGGNYKAMSDTASVTFEAPDDLRALDQTMDEYDWIAWEFESNAVDRNAPGNVARASTEFLEATERWSESVWGEWWDAHWGPTSSTAAPYIIQGYLNRQLK